MIGMEDFGGPASSPYAPGDTAAPELTRSAVAADTTPPRRIAVDPRRVDALDAEIGRLARQMHVDSYRMLELVREFDDRFGYAKWSHKTCAEWLAWRLQITLAAAREKVRTAQALRFLPKISAAFADGIISYTKARELTRVAREHDEELLLAYACNASAPQVAERCRQIRNVQPESADCARRAWERRSLTASRHAARNTLLISVELPAEDGEIVLRALECVVAAGEQVALGVDHLAAHGEERSKTDGWQAQQADALVAMSRAYLAGDVGDVGELDELGAILADRRGAVDGCDHDVTDECDGCGGDCEDEREGEGWEGDGRGFGDRGDNGDAAGDDGCETGAPEACSGIERNPPTAVTPGARPDIEHDPTAVAFFMSNGAVAAGGSDAEGSPHGDRQGSSAKAGETRRGRKRGTSVADHYQIMVRIDERALRDCGQHGPAAHQSGSTTPARSDLPLETIRRLACDCSLVMLVEDDNGRPIGISRKNRIVSTHLRRALLARDRGCTFPGCHRHWYLDAHHIKHWINKGETVPENLTLLCTYHHRLLHEGGFSIRKLDDDTLIFLRPDGHVIPRTGYRHEDMHDDFDEPIDAADDGPVVGAVRRAADGGCGGGPGRGANEVREIAPRYGPLLRAV